MHPIAYPIAASIPLLPLLISQATTITTTTPPPISAATAAAMTTKTISDPAAVSPNNITQTFLAGPYTYTLITLALYPDTLNPACTTDLAQHSSTIFAQLRSRCAITAVPIPTPTSNPRNTSSSVPSTDMRALRYGSWRCGQDRLYVDVLDEEDGSQRCLRGWMESVRVEDERVVGRGGVVVVRVLPIVVAVVGLVGVVCGLLVGV